MRFVEPSWLWYGLVACAGLAALMFWSARQQKRALARFSARPTRLTTGSLSPARRHLKRAALLLGTLALFAALARPEWGYHEALRREQGVDLLFALDTSKSMLAEDLRPNRLTRAKLAIEELLGRVAGDRLGLIAFAGDAFLQTPLTHDRAAFAQSLAALDTSVIPVGGSDLGSAIRVAERALTSEPDHQKVLVLLTDGEDLGGAALDAAREAKQNSLTLHTVGIGSEQGGEIPVRDAQGHAQLLRGPDGELVHSKLDAELLRKVAALTGGSYHALGARGEGLEQLYREQLAKLAPHTRTVHKARVYHERFQWPLAFGVALLLGEWLITDRRRLHKGRRAPAFAAAASLLALLTLAGPGAAFASDGAPLHHYNDAAANYRAGKFAEAARGYQSTLDTRDLTLQQRAYYDLGNALFRVGEGKRAQAPSETIAQYKKAISAYDSALALDAQDGDARFNREVVKRRLAELEREQQQKNSQSQSGQQNTQNDQQDKQGQQDKQDGQKSGQAGQQDEPRGQQNAQSGAPGNDGKPKSEDANGQSADAQKHGEQGERGAQGSGDQEQDKQAQAQQGSGTSAPHAAQEPAREGEGAGAEPGQNDKQPPSANLQGTAGERADASEAQGAVGGAATKGDLTAPQELTRAQAEQLLGALQGELRRLPSQHAQTAQTEREDVARKDW